MYVKIIENALEFWQLHADATKEIFAILSRNKVKFITEEGI